MCHKLHKIILVLATRGYLEKRRTSENCTGTGLEMIEMLKRIDGFSADLISLNVVLHRVTLCNI